MVSIFNDSVCPRRHRRWLFSFWSSDKNKTIQWRCRQKTSEFAVVICNSRWVLNFLISRENFCECNLVRKLNSIESTRIPHLVASQFEYFSHSKMSQKRVQVLLIQMESFLCVLNVFYSVDAHINFHLRNSISRSVLWILLFTHGDADLLELETKTTNCS